MARSSLVGGMPVGSVDNNLLVVHMLVIVLVLVGDKFLVVVFLIGFGFLETLVGLVILFVMLLVLVGLVPLMPASPPSLLKLEVRFLGAKLRF